MLPGYPERLSTEENSLFTRMVITRRFAGEEGCGGGSDDEVLVHQDKSVAGQWSRHLLPQGEPCHGVSGETRVRMKCCLNVVSHSLWAQNVTCDKVTASRVFCSLLLASRFNKIATQGAPQMAVDKEANSLSRVYSYYSKFNYRCLFYV